MIAIMLYVIAFALILFPTLTYAQSVQELLVGVMGFITVVLIPFILGVAFLVFAVNAVRFFVIGGDNTESQENAKSLALYGIGAFVIILSLWGIVNLIANGIGLNEGNCIDGDTIQSDYIDSNPPCSSPRPRPRPDNLNTYSPPPFGPQ